VSDLRLEHMNIPASDPLGLAAWYGRTFGLEVEKHVVRGPGLIIAFVPGAPLARKTDELHMGFRVPSLEALGDWAKKFAATPVAGPEFTSFRTSDPEGNGVELYTPSMQTRQVTE
jgi:catechol-2,3-dioxygenase